MHLIWKRPDGFHGASPADFLVVELGEDFRLWLHKSDKDQYPFRVSGGWEDDQASVRINNLVNLLGQTESELKGYLSEAFNHSMQESKKDFFDETHKWLETLSQCIKGDTWEIEILTQAIQTTRQHLEKAKSDFLAS